MPHWRQMATTRSHGSFASATRGSISCLIFHGGPRSSILTIIMFSSASARRPRICRWRQRHVAHPAPSSSNRVTKVQSSSTSSRGRRSRPSCSMPSPRGNRPVPITMAAWSARQISTRLPRLCRCPASISFCSRIAIGSINCATSLWRVTACRWPTPPSSAN